MKWRILICSHGGANLTMLSPKMKSTVFVVVVVVVVVAACCCCYGSFSCSSSQKFHKIYIFLIFSWAEFRTICLCKLIE